MATRFDPRVVPLGGINLVEASAGTGKTHAITDLYERLVVEEGCPVEGILVVTYTRAASGELRERIRTRLVGRLRALRRGDADSAGLACAGDPAVAEHRLELACARFDQAAIHTIHAFCQQALAESAFEGGQPFSAELVADDAGLVEGIVADFWRRRMAEAEPELAAFLLARGVGPGGLFRWVRPYVARSHLRVVAPGVTPDRAALTVRLRGALAELRARWGAEGAAVTTLLAQTPALKRNSYPAARFRGWRDALDAYCRSGASAVPVPVRKVLERLAPEALRKGTKKGHAPPEHPLFELAATVHTASVALEEAHAAELARWRAELIDFVRREVPRRNREERTRTYDDLLLGLERALSAPGPSRAPPGGDLAGALRRRYPYALIDEFQDTDPVQLAIFRAIYALPGPGGAFLVGDPKQAIYAFRGADVFAYLQGRADAARTYSLDTNRRSVPGLVDAVNGLFGRVPDPFVVEAIRFEAATAGRAGDGLVLEGEGGEPFRVWQLGAPDGAGEWTKADARARAADATAAAIVGLVAKGRNGAARVGDRPLTGADIAVLVRTNREARLIQEALAARGVRSVSAGRRSVYGSDEAMHVEWLLAAVCAPGREPLVRAALASPLFERSGNELAASRADEAERDRALAPFHRWREIWLAEGVGAMYRDVLERAQVPVRVLGRRFGERRTTNLLHLGELLQRAEAELHASPDELLAWLAAQRGRGDRSDDESEQRLESDDALVRIVTVHRAKGLQYPICFCPFAWDGRNRERGDGGVVFHDGADHARAVLDLSPEPPPAALAAATREARSEAIRLLYVALTRAQHRCYVAWGPVREAEGSALAWLLRPAASAEDSSPGEPGGTPAADWGGYDAAWRALRDAMPAAVALEPLPTEPAREQRRGTAPSERTGEARLRARAFRGRTDVRWGVSSFTALTSALPPELPDHDAQALEPAIVAALEDADGEIPAVIPRGARAGTCLHAVFERLELTAPVRGQLDMVGTALDEHGLDRGLASAVADLAERVLAADLRPPSGLRLDHAGLAQRVTELEFYFPVQPMRIGDLLAIGREHGYLEAVSGLAAESRLCGFLKGYVDLVFESAGRYYIVDYKTHWLGGAASDYRPDRLENAIRRDGYELQYLIYTVALHRYLAARAAGYRYPRDFGGVLYLFVRGMGRGPPGNGVYFHRPAPAVITALDAAFGGGTGD